MTQGAAILDLLQSATFWTAIGAIGTLLAVVAALRKDIIGLFAHPDLKIEFKELDSPDCDKNGPRVGVNYKGQVIEVPDGSYNIRIRVHNHGKKAATGAQVELRSVERVKESDERMKPKPFLPMNLVWCHLAGAGLYPYYHPFIAADSGAHFDLAVLFKDPETKRPAALLATIAHPPTWSTLLQPGTYRLTLQISFGGAASRIEKAMFKVPDTWYPTEQETFEKGPGFWRDPG